MGNKIPFYLQVLNDEFDRRKGINEGYSWRSFAAFLQVDPTYLSKCMARTQPVSFEIAEKVIARLNLEEEDRVEFLRSVAAVHSCMRLHKHDSRASGCVD